MTRGQKIRAAREKLSISQRELANQMGFETGNVVMEMEAGGRMSEPRRKLVARLLGIPVDHLVDDPEPVNRLEPDPGETNCDVVAEALALLDRAKALLEGARA